MIDWFKKKMVYGRVEPTIGANAAVAINETKLNNLRRTKVVEDWAALKRAGITQGNWV